MKNKVYSIVTLGVIGAALCACTKETSLVLSRQFSRNELKEEFRPKESKVYMDENGQLITLNDPSDPSVNVIKELRISDEIVSMYYSSSKNNPFNEEKQLSVKGVPSTAATGKITWSSSNPEIASVSEEGLVTALSEGKVTITATSENGLSASSVVYVNNNNVFLSEAGKSAKKILAAQSDESFVAPKTVKVKQLYSYKKTCDGEVVSSSLSNTYMWASTEQSYFRYYAEDEDVKTSGGSIVPGIYGYIFYTASDFNSYIFCTSQGKSNYTTLDQSYFVDEGKTRTDALLSMLNSFFVAGSSIMTNQINGILNADYLASTKYSGATYKGSFGEDSGEFAYEKLSSSGGAVAPEDEEDMGIPAGTQVTVTDQIRYLWDDNVMKVKNILETLDYSINGKVYKEVYDIKYSYWKDNVDLLFPKTSEFTQVDSIFDL